MNILNKFIGTWKQSNSDYIFSMERPINPGDALYFKLPDNETATDVPVNGVDYNEETGVYRAKIMVFPQKAEWSGAVLMYSKQSDILHLNGFRFERVQPE